jgi:hypothetical protein
VQYKMYFTHEDPDVSGVPSCVCANIKSRNAFECLHDVAMTTALCWGGRC